MASVGTKQESFVKSISLKILDEVMGPVAGEGIGVRLWDGTLWPDDLPKDAVMALKHPGALRNMLLPGTELGLAEAYLYDDFDIEGDIINIFTLTDGLAASTLGWKRKVHAARALLKLPDMPSPGRDGSVPVKRGPARLSGRQHSIERDRQAVTYHYNVSSEFYKLWLDQNMVYSCAYFRHPDEDLDAAQQNKLEHICRKLRLQPGQRLLDIGCGWGGLVLYAAEHFGVNATGVTLSQPQADFANQRIAAAGLQDRCRVLVQDYREVEAPEPYDALVSVGMFEHVGKALLPEYFRKAYQLLKPRGVFLNHGIGVYALNPPEPKPGFSDAYVFPDGEILPIHVTLEAAEGAGFEVRDVENLREHYALTLRHWLRGLETHQQEAIDQVGEVTFRVWRLFISGSSYGFRVGRLNIYQTLLSKFDDQGDSGLPMTREDLYR